MKLPDIALQLHQLGHQRQINIFEGKLNPQNDANKSFLGNLFSVSQRAVASMTSAAAKNPGSTLVYALLASPLAGANAKPYSTTTNSIANAFEDCWDHHRHDDFSFAFSKVRCLGELAKDICSDREPGTSSRYDYPLSQRKEIDVCTRLLGRAAGLRTTIPSAQKMSNDIIQDVIKDVTGNPHDRENIVDFDAEEIIDHYGLRGEVDDSINDSKDVWEWISRHRSALESKDHEGNSRANPPRRDEFIHAADNRYKESGDIKDLDTYKRVLEGINSLSLKPYVRSYYVELSRAISEKLGV